MDYKLKLGNDVTKPLEFAMNPRKVLMQFEYQTLQEYLSLGS